MKGSSVTLRTYLRVLRERWKMVVAFILAATALAILVTALTPKKYKATAQVYIAANGTGQNPTAGGQPTLRGFVTDQANAPKKPYSPTPLLNVILGLLLGLLVGAAFAVARDILDTRVKNADELAKNANGPVMGVIVEDGKT